MKKILMVVGAIFICLILVGVIVLSGLYYFASRLNKESKAYVDEVIPIIVSSWNSKELINHASPEFLQVVPAEEIESLFSMFSEQMGPLREYRGSTGRAKVSITAKRKVVVADYLIKAVFERAPAKIEVRTILRDDKWQILGFRVIVSRPYKEKILNHSPQLKGEELKTFGLIGHLLHTTTKIRLTGGN